MGLVLAAGGCCTDETNDHLGRDRFTLNEASLSS